MLMIGFLLFIASFLLIIHLLGFEEDKLIDWVRNQRLFRQPAVQEEVECFCDAKADSTEDSHVSMTLFDPDVLECPICCEPLKIPIFQCYNGHLACSLCRLCCNKVKNKCPSCNSSIGYNRCRAMEKVIEATRVSCPNAKYGCKENVSYVNPSSHENQCLFAQCSCPILDCNYTGSYKDLYNHFRANHKDDLVQFIWHITFVFEWDLSKKTIVVFQEEVDGELIVVKAFSGSHGLRISVSIIAPKVDSFSCCLKLGTNNIRLKHAMTLRNVQKVSDEHPQDGFILIPSYMLSSDGNLKISICISPGDIHLTYA